MKKSLIVLSILCSFLISLNAYAGQPVLSVSKSGGARHWYTFWKVTYNHVKYNSCDGSLTCYGSGVITCRAPSIISQGGNGYEIDNFLFDDEIISSRINITLDDVDEAILLDNSSSTGSLSNLYLLYDLEGNSHYVSFYAIWTNANWETGDAYIKIQMSVI